MHIFVVFAEDPFNKRAQRDTTIAGQIQSKSHIQYIIDQG